MSHLYLLSVWLLSLYWLYRSFSFAFFVGFLSLTSRVHRVLYVRHVLADIDPLHTQYHTATRTDAHGAHHWYCTHT